MNVARNAQSITAPKAFVLGLVKGDGTVAALESGKQVTLAGGIIAKREPSGSAVKYKLYAHTNRGIATLNNLRAEADAARKANTAKKNGAKEKLDGG